MTNHNPDNDRTETFVVLTPGTMVSHYRITDKIGAGGMGEVYLAEDTKLNRKVALKFLPARFAVDRNLQTRFRREAQAAAGLDHPGIVTIHEVDEFRGRPFFAMQYVDGQTLREYCGGEPQPLTRVLDFMLQLSAALASAHSGGIIHRDIKPANIVVDKDYRLKILDFGLATIQGTETITRAGSTLGTVAYMSPEQARGQQVDHRSDIFSLGIVMYEMLAGTNPFSQETDAATLLAISSATPAPLDDHRSDIPHELSTVLERTLAGDPADRYQSAADLVTDLQRIQASGAVRSIDSNSRTDSVKPSIAVLPFANMSPDPDNEYFADGLTEELLNVLAKSSELRVTGRTSSFAFKGKQEDLRGIGRKLGVETILEGSVRKAGDRVRITAQLVKTSDGFHLWSDTYDRVLEDIFAVQDDIAQSVAKALQVALFGSPLEKKAVNPESYALALRAHQSAVQLTESSVALACDLYKKALDLDPENARAWAGLGFAHLIQASYGYDDTMEASHRAREAARKALELDDTVEEAYQVVGWLKAALDYKFDEAEQAFQKAYALAPNNARIIMSLGIFHMTFARFEESLRLSRRAIDLEPLDADSHLQHGRNLLMAGKIRECQEAVSHALSLSPDLTTAHILMGWTYLFEGRPEEALAEVQKERSDGYRLCGEAVVYHSLGQKEESDRALNRLLDIGRIHWGVQIATVYAWRGENDLAFQWLEASVERHDAGIPTCRVHPMFRGLHDDPRWVPFLKKIGLL